MGELAGQYAKAMVFTAPRYNHIVDGLKAELGNERIISFSKIIQHVPETLVNEARELVEKVKPTVYIAIGGGSAIGLAK